METDVTPRAWRLAHTAIVGLVTVCTGLVSYQTAQISTLQSQVTDLKVAVATINATPHIGPTEMLAVWQAINMVKQDSIRMQSTIEYNTKQIDDLQKRGTK